MSKNRRKRKNKQEFSKTLLIQESILIWITTIALIFLAFICVLNGCYSDLPWLTAMVGLPWGAYGVSQFAYYEKAKKENTEGGIKYESVMCEMRQNGECGCEKDNEY